MAARPRRRARAPLELREGAEGETVKRRNLNAGQKAIAAAEVWELVGAPKNRRDQKRGRSELLAEQFGVSRAYVEQARALVISDAVGAAAVKAGSNTLHGLHGKSPGKPCFGAKFDFMVERSTEAAHLFERTLPRMTGWGERQEAFSFLPRPTIAFCKAANSLSPTFWMRETPLFREAAE